MLSVGIRRGVSDGWQLKRAHVSHNREKGRTWGGRVLVLHSETVRLRFNRLIPNLTELKVMAQVNGNSTDTSRAPGLTCS